jgi:hypothetical protein
MSHSIGAICLCLWDVTLNVPSLFNVKEPENTFSTITVLHLKYSECLFDHNNDLQITNLYF